MKTTLIHYINTLAPNSILRDIAERTLADLIRDEGKWVLPEPKRYNYRCRACVNIKTNEKYHSIREAAKSIRVFESLLGNDLRNGFNKYPVRFVA